MVYIETFDPTGVDTTKWTETDANSILYQQNGILQWIKGYVVGPFTAQISSFGKGWDITGDFDIQIDYNLFYSEGNYFNNGATLRMALYSGANSVWIEVVNNSGYYQINFTVNGSLVAYSYHGGLASKFRLIRTGSNVTAYYWHSILQQWIASTNTNISTLNFGGGYLQYWYIVSGGGIGTFNANDVYIILYGITTASDIYPCSFYFDNLINNTTNPTCSTNDLFTGISFDSSKWTETDDSDDGGFLTCNGYGRWWGDGEGFNGILSSQSKGWNLVGAFDVQFDMLVQEFPNSQGDKYARFYIYSNADATDYVYIGLNHTGGGSPLNRIVWGTVQDGVTDSSGEVHLATPLSTPVSWKFRIVRDVAGTINFFYYVVATGSWINLGYDSTWITDNCYIVFAGDDQHNAQTNSMDVRFDNLIFWTGCPVLPTTSTSSTSTSSTSTSSTSTSSTSTSTSSTSVLALQKSRIYLEKPKTHINILKYR